MERLAYSRIASPDEVSAQVPHLALMEMADHPEYNFVWVVNEHTGKIEAGNVITKEGFWFQFVIEDTKEVWEPIPISPWMPLSLLN